MNQNKVSIRDRRDSFSRLKFPSICCLVLVTAGLQGCDVSESGGIERSLKVDDAAVAAVVDSPELAQPQPVNDSENRPAVASANADTVVRVQEDGKPSDMPKPSSENSVTDTVEDDSVLSKAGKMVGDAASKSVKSASDAGQWVQEKLGDATKTGSQSASDTWEWANETFESLKSQGLTSAQTTSQWLGQDWKNMESWQYQIVVLDGEPTEVAKKLNEFGEQGWECFEVTETGPSSTKFYLKKPTFSYLRQLPFKDVIKLVPLMNAGEK